MESSYISSLSSGIVNTPYDCSNPFKTPLPCLEGLTSIATINFIAKTIFAAFRSHQQLEARFADVIENVAYTLLIGTTNFLLQQVNQFLKLSTIIERKKLEISLLRNKGSLEEKRTIDCLISRLDCLQIYSAKLCTMEHDNCLTKPIRSIPF